VTHTAYCALDTRGIHEEPVGKWTGRQRRKKEENELAITHLALTSHFICSPHPTEKGRPTSLRRGEGLTLPVPGRRERKERKAEAMMVMVMGDRRARSSAQFVSHPLLMVNEASLIREQLLLALHHHLPLSLLPPHSCCLAIWRCGTSKKKTV
jgi:hypothetical protein